MDAIERLTRDLLTKRGFAQEDRDSMAIDVRKEIREAIAWAEASPPPDISELYTDVYADTWGPYPGTSPPQMYEE
jgi:TPP-dependent pyruvate/acetoin dehydrogenase alpha subunit